MRRGYSRFSRQCTIARLALPLMLSAATTITAFATLRFSIMPGYRDLGRFAAFGIGATALFVVETDHGTVLEVAADPHAVRTGDRVGLSFTGIGVHVFPAASA